MSDASTAPATRADIKNSTKVWSLKARREFVLLWTMIAAMTLLVVVARSPAYHEAMKSEAPTADQTLELVAYMVCVIGFIISATLTASTAMIYQAQLIKEANATSR